MKKNITALLVAVMILTGMVTAPRASAETAGTDDEIKAPEPVGFVSAKAVKRGKNVIRWKKAKNADGYYIYKASARTGHYDLLKKVGDDNKVKCVHRYKKLKKNKKYYYKVFAYKKDSGKVLMSEAGDRDPAKNTLSYRKKIRMQATAYSGGGYCANGKRCRKGRVAVDPRVIPLGTWLYVSGYGFCQACDTGGAIKGKRIDVYFNSERKCNRYGRRGTNVYVLRK